MKLRFFRRRAVPALLLVSVGWLTLGPTEVEPVAWAPPAAPGLVGPYAANNALDTPQLLGVGQGNGPEHLAFDAQGRVTVGYDDGRLVSFSADGTDPRELANTGGRPLGLIYRGQTLIVADADKGLLAVGPRGDVQVLATEADGGALRFTDAVDVGHDGTLYFTDASSRFGFRQYEKDLLEHGARGRLLALSPTDPRPRVLLKDLQFANGVALAHDDSFLLFAETGLYRVSRLWLTGERAGQVDVVIDNLPGFVDNLSRGTNGVFWMGLTAPRDAALDALGPYPFLRKVVDRLPKALQPKARRFAHVIGIDATGAVKHNLIGNGEAHALVAGAVEHDGMLYLSSLHDPHFARVPLTPPRSPD